MVRPASVIVAVLVFDIVVIGGNLLLTQPLDAVIWIVPWFVLCSLLIAGYLYRRLSGPAAEQRGG